MTVTLAAPADCAAADALCTGDDRPLSAAVSATVAATAQTQTDTTQTDTTQTDTTQTDTTQTDTTQTDTTQTDTTQTDTTQTDTTQTDTTQTDTTQTDTTQTVTPPAFRVRFEAVPGGHDGTSAITFRVKFNKKPADYSYVTMRDSTLRISQGGQGLTASRARRLNAPHNDQWEVTITPVSTADLTVSVGPAASCSATGAVCAAVDFTVTLSRAAAETVTLEYATSDGTAVAGEDYTAAAGTLSFSPGRTTQTVSVAVLDDPHDEGSETFTLVLSNPSGNHAWLSAARATGTISNSDPLPRGWLARFGRTSATQVLGLLDARFDEARAPASQLTLGGRPVNLAVLSGRQTPAHTDPAAGSAAAHTDPFAIPDPAAERTTASPHALNSGAADSSGGSVAPSQFTLSGGAADHIAGSAAPDADPFDALAARYTLDDTAWGMADLNSDPAALHADPSAGPDPAAGAVGARGTATLLERLAWRLLTQGGWSVDRRQFLSRSSFDLPLSALKGETDAEQAAVPAGVGLAYNDGAGAYRASDSGAVGKLDSTLVSVHPYLHYALTDRLSAWGTLGYGGGTLSLRPARAGDAGNVGDGLKSVPGEFGEAGESDPIETGMQMRMGAMGLRGTVFANAATELALKTDLMWVRTTSAATAGLVAVDGADASRVRLLLTGRHRHMLATGAALTPNFELGLRYDDGAAETGAGVELGGGLRYADAALGLSVEATVRALLAHEAGGYEEWGLSGSLQLDPGRLGRGLSLRLASGWGLTDSSADALWQQQTASGLARGPGQTPQGRFMAEWGYGLDVPWTHGLLTPYGGVEVAAERRTLRLGWRFELGRLLSLSLAGERHEGPHTTPEHGLMLQTTLPW